MRESALIDSTVRYGSDMNDGTYRDSSGRSLSDYPRPSVAVDTAVLTLDPKLGLVVLEVRRVTGTGWALPGTFLYEGETLAEAVDRSLRDKANVRGLHPRQLHVFDDPHRDDRGWVLSVAHVEVVQAERLESRFVETTRLVPVRAPGRLPYDHADIIELAVEDVRSHYARQAGSGSDFSATSSPFGNCGSRTRRSPDSSCSATRSDARWNRNLSRPVPAASAEGAALPSFSADPSDQ